MLCPVYTTCGSRVKLINQKSISEQICLKKLHALLYSAYFHVYQIYNGFIIYNDFKNLILEVLHDIINNSTHFRQIWRVSAILDLLIIEPSNQNTNVTIVLSMVEKPHLDILHGHSNQFI